MRNEKRSGGFSLTAAIFLIAGVLIIAFGVYSLINGGSKYRGYKKIKAEVVEAQYEETTGATAAICVYEMIGRSYNYGHASKKHLEVGDKVTLYCSSDKPAYPVPSIIDTGALVIVFMGAGVAIVGLFIAMMSGEKGIGGVSFSSLETNAGGLIDGLESLLDETYEDDEDEAEEEDEDDRISALSGIESNAGKLIDGLEAILNGTYEDEEKDVEEPSDENEDEPDDEELSDEEVSD